MKMKKFLISLTAAITTAAAAAMTAMSAFAEDAAQTTESTKNSTSAGSALLSLVLPLGIMFALLYFIAIKPQKKRDREMKAMQESLQVGDEIVAVDGNEVAGQSASDVVMQIRGEVGTEVQLTILRAGEQMDVTLQRDVIHVPTVKGSMLDNGVGYMRISMFAENTDELFTEELQKLEDQDMRGLIIDLRGNPGGLLKSVVKIGKLIVPQGPIVSVKERDGSQREYGSELAETKYPIVVLIDGNSASAAEILAGALQDTGAATLVGTKSYGKGSVQSVIPLTQGEGLKLTIAKYYTPSGRCIDGIGIEPDVEVDLPQDGTVEDTQLAKAREIMQQKLAE